MENKALIEAAIFISDKALTNKKLSKITGLTEKQVSIIVLDLQKDMEKNIHGIDLIKTPDGYEFRLKPEYSEKVSKLAPYSDISEGSLRTLAIIASNQPVKQSIIVKYQGNKAYGYIEKLIKKGLISSEKEGRTKIISTTNDFEKYFGKKVEDVKRILENSKND